MKNKGLFSSSPWGFRFWNLEEYCDFMKSLGIRDICTMFGEPAKFPLAFRQSEEECAIYKKTVEQNGLRIFEVAIGSEYRNEIRLASRLDAELVRICDVWNDDDATMEKIISMLRDAGKVADEYGITVVVENHGGLLARADKCLKILQSVDMPNVKLNYDPANFYYYGEDPLYALEKLSAFIGLVHLKNVKKENGKKEYCRIADGLINYCSILKRLLPEYEGYLCLEYEEPSDVRSGTADDMHYLEKLLE